MVTLRSEALDAVRHCLVFLYLVRSYQAVFPVVNILIRILNGRDTLESSCIDCRPPLSRRRSGWLVGPSAYPTEWTPPLTPGDAGKPGGAARGRAWHKRYTTVQPATWAAHRRHRATI